ncbi:hypothetical protein KDW_30880 [Dictyobacter vulcani]|uniref:non-specific serine/threonine protein kinase n=1 Tax=Dictyobacter vulcani TaxID=2607529 RepID=A0A5J4KUM0_9CHLR|nr:hypothetical protein KDW_30880 [Dictyobacter vulcani]
MVLKVHNQISGAVTALKLGKVALEENYRALQPMLTAIKESGISTPQYLSYDARLNGILMEYIEGDSFAHYIEQLEQQQRTLPETLQMYALCLSKLIALHSTLELSHGDAHEENWLIDKYTPALIDFRHSPTIPYTSTIYRHRDIFAMLCSLYRLVYRKHFAKRQEVKHAIMHQSFDCFVALDEFPQISNGNRYDLLLQQFLFHSIYNPHNYTLQDIAHIVNEYLRGFSLT